VLFYLARQKPFYRSTPEQKEDAMRRFKNFLMQLSSENFGSLKEEVLRAEDFARKIETQIQLETAKSQVEEKEVIVEIA